MSSFINTARQFPRSLGSEVKLSLGVGLVCLIVGAAGSLANLIAPETTLLDGLWIVALFYFSLAAGGIIKRRSLWQGTGAPIRSPVLVVSARPTRRHIRHNRSLAS